MKRKVCSQCNSKRNIDKFYSYGNICKLCTAENRIERRSYTDYKPVTTGNKTCTKCLDEKPIAQFTPDKMCKDGRSSWCYECKKAAVKLSKKNYEYKSYSETHPEKWKEYINEYKKEYVSDPIVGRRVGFAQSILRQRRAGNVTPACNCMTCGKEAKTSAYVPTPFILKSFKRRVSATELIKAIVWQCKECMYARRKKRD